MFADGNLAGASQVPFASLKLLCASVGGTQRSSTQNNCTRFQSKGIAAKISNIGRGDEPPEIASVDRGESLRYWRICAAQCSAASRASANVRRSLTRVP